MKSYLSTAKVARLFGVNIQTVRGYIRSGELPAARVGRSYVVSGDDIDTFVEARKVSGGVEADGAVRRRHRESRRGERHEARPAINGG